MNTRILFLSFYYPPDLAAGSFRAEALVKALLAAGGDKVQVDVITTLPNRYHVFNMPTLACEETAGLRIRRIATPSHRSGFVDQARAFLAFARGARKLIQDEHYDLIVASSSRLMTATLGALFARRHKTPLYLDIRDIFVDTLPDLFPSTFGKLATLIFSWVERWTINQAAQVNLISPGFLAYFKLRYPHKSFSLHTNGVDDLFLEPVPLLESPVRSGPVQVLYAGNIGTGQGLHHILPPLAKRLEGEVHFRVIGAGSAVDKLSQALSSTGVNNVELLPPMKRSDLLDLYQRADVLFLHLNKFRAFRRVLPSKLFEYAATGKPIWAGLSGYSAKLTSSKINNAALFKPCDVDDAVDAFRKLALRSVCRAEFIDSYSRRSINKLMARDVLSTPGYRLHRLPSGKR